MKIKLLGGIGEQLLIRWPLEEPDDAHGKRGDEVGQEKFGKLHLLVLGNVVFSKNGSDHFPEGHEVVLEADDLRRN